MKALCETIHGFLAIALVVAVMTGSAVFCGIVAGLCWGGFRWGFKLTTGQL